MLCGSIHVTFSNRQTCCDREHISGCQGRGVSTRRQHGDLGDARAVQVSVLVVVVVVGICACPKTGLKLTLRRKLILLYVNYKIT